jgi:hypothetical protein
MPPSIDQVGAVPGIGVNTAAAIPSEAARQRSWLLVGLFSVTLFLSAFLLFIVEPMIARMVLPLLGGAAAVWNTCLVFFQTLLLVGYAYAHGTTTWLGPRRHAILHLVVLLAPLAMLPIGLRQGAPPTTENPVGWLLLALLTSIGLPFFVLSTSAAVLQKWYSSTDDEGAKDPYFLYAASNLGSFVALIAYPLAVEPTLRLQQQVQLWSAGYLVFIALTVACAVALWRRGSEHPAHVADVAVAEAESITWSRRARWTLLAFVPSSLLLAVTSHISTDVAAVPLLWIVPLSLYLLTFIVAFSRGGTAIRSLAERLMPILVTGLVLFLIAQINRPMSAVVPFHLLVFATVALVCHSKLAADRPSAARLTGFYLWISVGGMLGGLFNALLAPVIFVRVAEYPIVLVLSCLLVAAVRQAPTTRWTWAANLAIPAAVGAITLASVLLNNRLGSPSRGLILGAAIPAVIAFGQRHVPLRFAACLALMLAAGTFVQGAFGRAVYSARTFFGVYRVELQEDLQFRVIVHGTTLHGMQFMVPERRNEPLSYFHRTGPVGQLFASVPVASQTSEVAVAGLGVGSLASYRTPSQRWTFYEIDPFVERVARDTAYFTYLADCGAQCTVLTGDARLSMASARPAQFGLIFLDAFSSDAIPMHLLTREAMAMYLSKLAPGGVMAMNVSNIHLSIYPVITRVAREQGLTVLWQREPSAAGSLKTGKFPSEWVVMARDARDLGSLTSDARWKVPAISSETPLWTDDFSNILSVIRR